MPPDPPPAALRLDIDHDALSDNWRTLDRLSGEASAGAAVKADGYGLGVAAVVPTLHAAGCRDFFVAHWGEVAAVAAHAPATAIAVLHGVLCDADVAYARAIGARPVINSLAQARRWLAAGGGPCDLMIDTGINRLGLPMADIGDEAIGRLEASGLMREMTDRLATDDELAAAYRAAHEAYLARREEIGHVDEIAGISAGGMPNRVKCLHVLVGHALAADVIWRLLRAPRRAPEPAGER